MTLAAIGQSTLLQKALAADAVITGVTGVAMFLGAGFLASLLGLPVALLRYAGLSLIPFAAFVAVMATRDQVSRVAVRAIIIANALWVVDSFLLLLTGWVQPSLLGYAFVIGQAVIVAGFAEVQHVGLKTA
jgi:hypothetical protein